MVSGRGMRKFYDSLWRLQHSGRKCPRTLFSKIQKRTTSLIALYETLDIVLAFFKAVISSYIFFENNNYLPLYIVYPTTYMSYWNNIMSPVVFWKHNSGLVVFSKWDFFGMLWKSGMKSAFLVDLMFRRKLLG